MSLQSTHSVLAMGTVQTPLVCSPQTPHFAFNLLNPELPCLEKATVYKNNITTHPYFIVSLPEDKMGNGRIAED